MSAHKIHFEEALGSAMADKRIEILRSIHQAGSISEAARANGVSYKAAWQAVETLGNLAGVPLIGKVVGGSGGGGARLTAEGLQVLHAAETLNVARQKALMRLRGETKRLKPLLRNITGIGLRTSMRNQLPSMITDIRKTQGTARVWLELPNGQHLVSRVTPESLQLLGLKKGLPVLVLCKAAAVTIAPTIVAMGDINLLEGKIARRIGAKADRQVSLELSPGLQLAGFAAPETELKPKQPAMAAIDESAVVIGLPS